VSEPFDVLHEHVSRSKLANDSGVLGPEPSLVVLRKLEAGIADGLAWKASAEKIDPWSPLSDICHVGVAGHVGPVLVQHESAERVGLALPHDTHTGSLEAEIETAGLMPENRLPTVSGASSDIQASPP